MGNRRIFLLSGLLLGVIVATTASLSGAMPVAKIDFRKFKFSLVDFIPSGEVIANHVITEDMSKAVPRISIISGGGQYWGSCSAVVVSDSGIILTDSHCIDSCKIKDYSILSDSHVVVDNSHKRATDCDIVVNDTIRMPLNVIDTSGCPISVRARNAKKMVCPDMEWALIQLDLTKTGPLPCMAIDSKAQPYGLPVGTIGFPTATTRFTERAAARDSEGRLNQYFSDGKILPYQNYCITEFDDKKLSINGRLPFPDVSQRQSLKDAVLDGLVYQTDVDFVEGSSGSPLFDLKSRKMIGISSFSTMGNPAFECKGSTFFSSLRAIMSELKTLNPSINVEQIFSCKSPAGL